MFKKFNYQMSLNTDKLSFICVVISLLFATSAFAQRVTNIDAKGTKHITGNIVTQDTTAPLLTDPVPPIQGDIWLDTTDPINAIPYVWDGDSWELLNAASDAGIPVYADAATRDADITTPSEGQVVYMEDSDKLFAHNGTDWVSISAGALWDDDKNTGIQVEESADENPIRFDTGGTERMVITATGDIGVGTDAPSGTFHIVNDVDGADDVAANDDDDDDDVIVTADGHVGIGTATPSVPFEVIGEGDFRTVYISDNTSVASTISMAGTAVIDDGDWAFDAANNNIYLAKQSDNTAARGAGTEVVITDAGKVGIGTTAITAGATLDVNGDVYANGVQLTSDKRYKTDIKELTDALDIVLQLRGVRHQWKQGMANKKFPKGTVLGLIAQEVEPYLPEVVRTDQDGYKSVDYTKLTPLLIEAIQSQQAQLDAQEKRLLAIEKRFTKRLNTKAMKHTLHLFTLAMLLLGGSVMAQTPQNADPSAA